MNGAHCRRCQTPGSDHPWETCWQPKPLEILAVDFTVLEPAVDGRENVLVMTDQKATTTAKFLVKEWFFRYGIPLRIHSAKEETLKVKLLQNFADFMESRNRALHPITPKKMRNVKDSTGLYMTCSERYLHLRSADGLNTYQSYHMFKMQHQQHTVPII